MAEKPVELAGQAAPARSAGWLQKLFGIREALMVVIIFAGLLHHAGAMVFGRPTTAPDRGPENWSPLLAMMLLAAIMVLLGLTIPGSFDGVLQRATEIVID